MIRARLFCVCLLVALLQACVGQDFGSAGNEGSFGIKLAPAGSACEPPAGLNEISVAVVDPKVQPPEVLAENSFNGDSGKVSLAVPEGTGLELSILAWSQDKPPKPLYFGRARNLTVQADKTTSVSLSLNRLAGFNCVNLPPSAANLMFPTTTALPDGRVLVAGGYTKVGDLGDRYEIYGPSNRAYIFDPSTNTIRQVNNTMNLARGAHAAVYLPQKQQVMLVGGAETLYFQKNSEFLPLYFEKNKVGSVGATYELFDTVEERFIPYSAWPDESTRMNLNKNRVFPVAVLNTDGTVLVTGGGLWPTPKGLVETDPEYKMAELYRPKSDNYTGGFLDTEGALTMSTIRTGHAAALLEVKEKLSYHLFWGGNLEGPVAEIYQESSGQLDGNWGVFKPATFVDGAAYSKKPFFSVLTPLSSKRFLLSGGVVEANSKLKPPSASDAYLVTANSSHALAVDQVAGMGQGRYLHSALSWDGQYVTVFGGLTSTTAGGDVAFTVDGTNDVRIFDLKAKKFMDPPTDETSTARAGHGAVLLPNDCIFYAGGVSAIGADLQSSATTPPLSAVVHCPGTLCPESLWGNGCYAL